MAVPREVPAVLFIQAEPSRAVPSQLAAAALQKITSPVVIEVLPEATDAVSVTGVPAVTEIEEAGVEEPAATVRVVVVSLAAHAGVTAASSIPRRMDEDNKRSGLWRPFTRGKLIMMQPSIHKDDKQNSGHRRTRQSRETAASSPSVPMEMLRETAPGTLL